MKSSVHKDRQFELDALGRAVSRKRCKIGGKLVANRKSYMSFRFVPKSVTLNELERRNGSCVISPTSVVSGAHCVKVVADVVVKKFPFAISSPDEFLVRSRRRTCRTLERVRAAAAWRSRCQSLTSASLSSRSCRASMSASTGHRRAGDDLRHRGTPANSPIKRTHTAACWRSDSTSGLV